MEKFEREPQEAGRLRLGTITEWSRRSVCLFHVSESPMSFESETLTPFFVWGLGERMLRLAALLHHSASTGLTESLQICKP